MRTAPIIDLSVAEIMSNWPSTIRIFIDQRMHCVGCPISPFHTLPDAAGEHQLALDLLTDAIEEEISRARARDGQASGHRR